MVPIAPSPKTGVGEVCRRVRKGLLVKDHLWLRKSRITAYFTLISGEHG